MELDISTMMMIFFILLLVMSIWKVYMFIPTKKLVDDDTTEASREELTNLILSVIKKSDGKLTSQELFELVHNDDMFDKKHFWRFNQNRLNQLLVHYYLEHENIKTIEDIYKTLD